MFLDGFFYHVYNRGAHKLPIFLSGADYQSCLELINQYRFRYSVSVLAYCLMPNHYHMILRQETRGSISRFIQTSFNAYSQAFNLRRDHSGTLFQGKMKRKVIMNEDQLPVVARYIHLNPALNGLVDTPEKWFYSDCQEWLGLRHFALTTSELRDRFFGDPRDYKEFLGQVLIHLPKA